MTWTDYFELLGGTFYCGFLVWSVWFLYRVVRVVCRGTRQVVRHVNQCNGIHDPAPPGQINPPGWGPGGYGAVRRAMRK
jgi:hypothetical protein